MSRVIESPTTNSKIKLVIDVVWRLGNLRLKPLVEGAQSLLEPSEIGSPVAFLIRCKTFSVSSSSLTVRRAIASLLYCIV
jgi:hypothetical protein